MDKERPLNQGAWSRIVEDTIKAQQTVKFAWFGGGVLAVVGGTWLAAIAPQNATVFEVVARGVLGGLGGLVLAVLLIFMWNVILTPYKQRNEARRLLNEIPSKRKIMADKLAGFYLSGVDLKAEIADEKFNGDAIALVRTWEEPLKEYCYAEPDILGE